MEKTVLTATIIVAGMNIARRAFKADVMMPPRLKSCMLAPRVRPDSPV